MSIPISTIRISVHTVDSEQPVSWRDAVAAVWEGRGEATDFDVQWTRVDDSCGDVGCEGGLDDHLLPLPREL